MEIINLNLIPTGTRPVVHASQFDNGRQFRANLFEGASVYTLTGVETLTFSVRKPDGHIVTEAVTNTSDNYVVIETTTQMCACAGDSFAELKIENGDDLIGTLNLILAVEQSPEEGGDPSESFIHNLEQQIYDAVADQYDADSVIFDNTPTAGHGIPYAVTSEGIEAALPKEIDDLGDVTYTGSPAAGEALVWDGAKWTNGIPTLDVDDLNDVTVTAPTNGEIMVYNNGVWENQANPASTTNFAPDYDDTATYNTNDKVIYQGLLYICNDDNVTGTWDTSKWDAYTVADITGKTINMSSTDPDKVADRIEALESRTDITSSVTFNETVTGTLTQFYVKADVLYIFYQGESKSHSASDLLFTLPSGKRPSSLTYTTFVSSNGINFIFGTISINTNGECKVNQISDSSGAGRVYFTCAIPL